MKHFEACVGNQWMAWDASDTVKIQRKGEEVIVTSIQEKDGNKFTLKTTINLYVVPAYACA